MHICGTTYRMEANEALNLASKLADAVSDLKTAEKKMREKGDTDNVHQN